MPEIPTAEAAPTQQPAASASHLRANAAAAAAIAFAVALGLVLRFVWPGDIEYKGDERWMFEQVQAYLAGGPWPWVGIGSSLLVPHPGMSTWLFILLARVLNAHTPPELAQGVQLLNALGILGWLIFARLSVPAAARRAWYWAAALWAVNPLAIIFERKIWQPSLLPAFVVAFAAAWWYRARAVPAFLWGVLGAALGQIYMPAWFFTLAVLIWTLLYDRRSVHWPAWLLGNVVAGWPVLPWLIEIVFRNPDYHAFETQLPLLHYYLRWPMQPFGFGIDYTLGRTDMLAFLGGPQLAGHATYLMGIVYAAVVILMLTIAAAAIARGRSAGQFDARALFVGGDETGVLLRAAFWGYGGLLTAMTLAGLNSHRHYLIMTAPLMALWAARAIAWSLPTRTGLARAILIVAVLCQAALSAGLIGYIHTTQVIHGEYGPTWRSQQH